LSLILQTEVLDVGITTQLMMLMKPRMSRLAQDCSTSEEVSNADSKVTHFEVIIPSSLLGVSVAFRS
jgi:hypothetical protein